MQNFIVLGIIPGTNFQTTFDFWLGAGAVLFSLPLLLRLYHKRHVLHAYLAGRKINHFILHYRLPV